MKYGKFEIDDNTLMGVIAILLLIILALKL